MSDVVSPHLCGVYRKLRFRGRHSHGTARVMPQSRGNGWCHSLSLALVAISEQPGLTPRYSQLWSNPALGGRAVVVGGGRYGCGASTMGMCGHFLHKLLHSVAEGTGLTSGPSVTPTKAKLPLV